MAIATVYVLPASAKRSFRIKVVETDGTSTLKKYLPNYRLGGWLNVSGKEGEDVAEEVFDLTNNPEREDECMKRGWGNGLRVNVGDIVDVDGKKFLCAPIAGWIEVDIEKVV